MIKEAIEKIEAMGKPEMLQDFYGRWWSTKSMSPLTQPLVPGISVDTLTGLVAYVEKIVETTEVFLLVGNPWKVSVLGTKEVLPGRVREWYGEATFELNKTPFRFSEYMDLEQFIIGLQVMFEQDENTATILKIVGNLSDSVVNTFADDGVSQAVTARTSITKQENVVIPRILELAPWRTFREVEQPKSRFIFRMKQQENKAPACALFDVGGDLWKIEAMARIQAYLVMNLPDNLVIA